MLARAAETKRRRGHCAACSVFTVSSMHAGVLCRCCAAALRLTRRAARGQVRAAANGVAVTANWAANALVANTFLSLSHAMGASGVFWLYASVAACGAVWVLFSLPETAGAAPGLVLLALSSLGGQQLALHAEVRVMPDTSSLHMCCHAGLGLDEVQTLFHDRSAATQSAARQQNMQGPA